MSDYREMFLNYTKGLDPDIVKMMEEDQKPAAFKGVICLKCGTLTLQGEKCCDQPIHNKV